ncbi:MAG TPA: hypothetical protein VMB50_08140 [Myxococcales bacterium]|nr:hypothetical protein [Myxococcales bacterium]
MYSGHFAAGLAIGAKERRVPPLAILMGVGFLDLVNGVLVMAGIEHVRPAPAEPLAFDLVFIDWDHSIAMALVWSALFGGLVYLLCRRDLRAGVVGGLAALSHIVLDIPVHNGDLALWPGSSMHLGFYLWHDYPVFSYVLELGLDLACAAYFVRRERAAGARGARLVWPVALLLGLHLQRWPAIDPMHWVAHLPMPTAQTVHGLLVFAGFLGPGALFAWLVTRARRGALPASP